MRGNGLPLLRPPPIITSLKAIANAKDNEEAEEETLSPVKRVEPRKRQCLLK